MCPECKARRELARNALMQSKFKEAIGHVAKGAAEIVEVKPKTGLTEKLTKFAKAKKKPGIAG